MQAGAAGAAALVLLALGGWAPAPGALVLAAAVLALALWLARRPPLAPRTHAAEPSDPQFAQALAAVEALPTPVLIVVAERPDASDRRWTYANPAARETLRLQGEGGLVVSAIRDPEVLEAIEEALFGRVRGRAALRLAGPQERTFAVTAEPLAAQGAIVILEDETEARRSAQTRSDFLANASHELRTPLASLAGFIETLRGHAKDDEEARDRFLGIMQGQTDRMARLVDDLLSLSRIELNEHIPPSEAVDLSLAVADVLDALAPLAADRGVAIQTELPPHGQAVVTGDRDQILQVVQNLVDNAIKYSAAGQVVRLGLLTPLPFAEAMAGRSEDRVRATLLTPAVGPELYAVLRVEDEGSGLAREHLPRLSERFYRVEGQKRGPGTGLGLAIVKHIMARHRGGLVVESAPGAGTAFSAAFPLRTGSVTKLS